MNLSKIVFFFKIVQGLVQFDAMDEVLGKVGVPPQRCQVRFTNPRGYSACGATLIGGNRVLTAAHCTKTENVLQSKDIQVQCLDKNGVPQIRTAKNLPTIDPLYVFDDKKILGSIHDLATIDLDGAAIDNEPARMCASQSETKIRLESGRCSLWGFASLAGDFSAQPSLRRLNIFPDERMHEIFDDKSEIPPSNYLTWVLEEHVIKHGDSGSSLACLDDDKHWYIVGVTSAFSGIDFVLSPEVKGRIVWSDGKPVVDTELQVSILSNVWPDSRWLN